MFFTRPAKFLWSRRSPHSLIVEFLHRNAVAHRWFLAKHVDNNVFFIFIFYGLTSKSQQRYLWIVFNFFLFFFFLRDIKCSNILITSWGGVKMDDFGLSKVLDEIQEMDSYKGTTPFMAPEVARCRDSKGSCYGLAADIWSIGCTVLNMLTKNPPYHPLKREALLLFYFWFC